MTEHERGQKPGTPARTHFNTVVICRAAGG